MGSTALAPTRASATSKNDRERERLAVRIANGTATDMDLDKYKGLASRRIAMLRSLGRASRLTDKKKD